MEIQMQTFWCRNSHSYSLCNIHYMLFILMLLFPARPSALQRTTDAYVDHSLINSYPTPVHLLLVLMKFKKALLPEGIEVVWMDIIFRKKSKHPFLCQEELSKS